jgi:4-aminobutyrate aminotransferase-like enzyme
VLITLASAGPVLATELNAGMSSSILSRHKKNLLKVLYPCPGRPIKRAEGLYVEDVDGNRYLDFMSGGFTAVGYSHPKVIEAIVEQAKKGADNPRSDHFLAVPELHSDLAEEIKSFVPNDLADGKILFGHSGSDIVERSIRLVRFATKRPMIISHFDAHHGATSTALSASPTLKEMGTNIVARFFQLPGFLHVPFPDPYRPWFGSSADEGKANLEFLERLMSTVVSPQMIAGIIVEPILSMGGNIVPPDGYFQGLVKLCNENQIPLIADEIMTGITKTGRMFAMEHWDVWPDVICLGKALSGSLPLSILLARSDLAEKWDPKDHAPMGRDGYILGCAASIAILRLVHEERLVERAEKMGNYLMKCLRDLKEERGLMGQIRGLGLMVGFDLVESEDTKKPASDLAENVALRVQKHGLIIGTVGVKGNILRLMPSTIVDENQIDTAVDILDRVFRELASYKS